MISLPFLISTLRVGPMDDIEDTLITLFSWVFLHVLRCLMRSKKAPQKAKQFVFLLIGKCTYLMRKNRFKVLNFRYLWWMG